MTTLNIDILSAPVRAIAHCANCFCTMGVGVAKVIKEAYPEVYEADCETERGDKGKLGRVSIVKLDSNRPHDYCFNLYGQYKFGKERQVNYEAIFTALLETKDACIIRKIKSIAFPYGMASRNAGGDWRIIEQMIEVAFENSGIEVIICTYP